MKRGAAVAVAWRSAAAGPRGEVVGGACRHRQGHTLIIGRLAAGALVAGAL